MKLYESLYLIGTLLIIVSIASYRLSTIMVANPEDNSASNLLGETTEVDTTFTIGETLSEITIAKRQNTRIFLWIGIALGIAVLLAGIFIKITKEGKDKFIDDELDEDDDADF